MGYTSKDLREFQAFYEHQLLKDTVPFWFRAIHEADILLKPGVGSVSYSPCIVVPVDSRLLKTK